MADLHSFYSTWSPRLLSILRIVTALLFMEHGGQKLFGWFGGYGLQATAGFFEQNLGMAPGIFWATLAGVLELFGGLLILLGLFTRPVAFILAGEMAVAYFMAHAPQGFWPVLNRGELAVLYCFVFLYLAVAGGGLWSVDHLWRGGEASHSPSAA